MTDIVIRTRIVGLQEKKKLVGGNAPYEEVGFYVQFENSLESVWVGTENPDLAVGDAVTITIRRDKKIEPAPAPAPVTPAAPAPAASGHDAASDKQPAKAVE